MIVIIAVELCPLLHLLHTISGCGLAKHRMKLKTMKFSSEGLGRNSVKFCTSKNFPLYGNGERDWRWREEESKGEEGNEKEE